jgi:aspartate aminotransferase
MIAEYRLRRDALYEELMNIPGVVCRKPNGAFYIMAKLPLHDVEAFAKWLLTDFQHEGETTMIAPGPGFYATPGAGADEARFAYVLNAPDCRRAVRIVAEGIAQFNARS